MIRSCIGCVAALGLLVGAVSTTLAQGFIAGTTSVVINPGTENGTDVPLSGFITFGSEMAGTTVRAVFTDGTSEQVVWEKLVLTAGGAIGDQWSLVCVGDTFFLPWRLTNKTGKGITRIEIDGAPGDTLFDLSFGGAVGTPGSSLGHTFEVLSGQGTLDIRATYSDIVGVQGAAPVGDLFRRLTIEFLDAGGFPSNNPTLRYRADSDNIEFAGEIGPVDRCCQPWDNGRYDEHGAQTSQEGTDADWNPYRRIAADDLWLCEGQLHRVDRISGIMCTDAVVPKAKIVIYADCNGVPGEKIAEASAVRSADDDLQGNVTITETGGMTVNGFRIIEVSAEFDKVYLVGGAYWVSFVGFSGTGDWREQFFWGTSGNGVIKGRPGLFNDSDAGEGWVSSDQLCCGCTDYNFCLIGESCKVLIDNGGPDTTTLGSPSLQNGSRTADAVRSADQFVVSPCDNVGLCHIEAYLWTNCDRIGLDLYGAGCHCPAEAPCFATLTTDCLIDVGPTMQVNGQTLRLVRAIFADFPPFELRGGRNYWLSAYALGDGRQNARGYFAYTDTCERVCGNFDPGCVKGAPYATSSWHPIEAARDLAFRVAVLPDAPTRPPVVTGEPEPTCAADVNDSGDLTVQDIYDFVEAFFRGCP